MTFTPPRPDVLHAALMALPVAAFPGCHDHAEVSGIVTATDLRWRAGPASLAQRAYRAVLEGDPSEAGMFVLRL